MRIYLSSMAVTLPTAALNATHAYPSTIFQRLWCFCAVVRNYSSQRIWMNSVCYFSYSLTVDDNVRRQIGIESSVWRKKKYGLNRRSDPFIMSTSDVFWISYSRCRLFFFCRQDCVLMWLYTLPNTRQQLNEDFAEHSYFNYVLGHALYFFSSFLCLCLRKSLLFCFGTCFTLPFTTSRLVVMLSLIFDVFVLWHTDIDI